VACSNFISAIFLGLPIYICYDLSKFNKKSVVGFKNLIAALMNVAIFWDIVPRSPHVNSRFGGTYCLHRQNKKKQTPWSESANELYRRLSAK
jgi:hypothetical protein